MEKAKLVKGFKQNSLNGSENLSGWDNAISEAQRQIAEARQRIATLNRSIRTLKVLRDEGATFPEPKRDKRRRGTFESTSDLLGQKGDLGQSPHHVYSVTTVYFITTWVNPRIP